MVTALSASLSYPVPRPRPPSDLVGEAIKQYLSERRRFRKDHVHSRIAKGLESLVRAKTSTERPSWPKCSLRWMMLRTEAPREAAVHTLS